MGDEWIPVYSTQQPYQAEIIKQVLADNQIIAFVLNQQDSFYKFGNINVCVKPENVIKAKHVLKSVKF
jgi:hypothetical protein